MRVLLILIFNINHRHASIDPATRAARGLPEDLIRLCVGIEDVNDLLDDLERALIDAGAIEFNMVQSRYLRVPGRETGEAITRAVEKLALDGTKEKEMEWLVSAPGKVILFGEHAVVHGVVSHLIPWIGSVGIYRIYLPLTHVLARFSLHYVLGVPRCDANAFL